MSIYFVNYVFSYSHIRIFGSKLNYVLSKYWMSDKATSDEFPWN